MTYQELGQFIKEERKKLQLTQKELAQLTNISERTIREIETGNQIHSNNITGILKIFGWELNIEYTIYKQPNQSK